MSDRPVEDIVIDGIDKELDPLTAAGIHPTAQKALVEKFIDGKSNDDIAKSVGLEKRTASRMIRQAVSKLKAYLKLGDS